MLFIFFACQVLHPLQQRFLNLINQENFAQISQEEAVKREIVATLEALCGIAEATQIDNVASLFSFLMDFLSSCIGLMEVGAQPGEEQLMGSVHLKLNPDRRRFEQSRVGPF